MPSYEIKAWLTIEAASKERAVDLAEGTIEGFDAICRVARCQAYLIGRRSILLAMLSEVLLLGYYLAQEEDR